MRLRRQSVLLASPRICPRDRNASRRVNSQRRGDVGGRAAHSSGIGSVEFTIDGTVIATDETAP